MRSLARETEKLIVDVTNRIRKLQEELSAFGIHITSFTQEMFVGADSKATQDLRTLKDRGVSWDNIKTILKAHSSEHNKLGEFSSTKVLNERSGPRDIRLAVKLITSDINKLAKELKDSSHEEISYVSKDVFLSMHPSYAKNLDYLEQIGINWFQLISLSGISNKTNSKNQKKQLALTLKQAHEMFGVTTKHLLLFQRLIGFFMSECPEGLNKFVNETLGIKNTDEKFYRNLISNISNLINYLKLIE